MITIHNISFLRAIAQILPLKKKLHFLASKQLYATQKLVIPYTNNYSIITPVNNGNRGTISELIFEGVKSQPEYTLISYLQGHLADNIVMIDIGGNIGSFTCQFLSKASMVYIFEPIPRLYQVIQDSLEYNKIKNVQLIKKALGNTETNVTMFDNNNSSIVVTTGGDPTIQIKVTTLDNELGDLKKVDFVKVDVEGFEMHVLQGSEQLISKFHPTILLELHPLFIESYGYTIYNVIDWLEQHNYKIKYFSFLEENRQNKVQRIINRWKKNPGILFEDKDQFLQDVAKKPPLTSYHLLCE